MRSEQRQTRIGDKQMARSNPKKPFASQGRRSRQAVAIDSLPTLDLAMMMPVLMGMLGLGGLRTYEKRTETNKNR
jgi:hypothetical protein